MPQADPKDRRPTGHGSLRQLPHGRDLRRHARRIARPRREDDQVGLGGGHVGGGCVVGQDRHRQPAPGQRPQQRALDAEVDERRAAGGWPGGGQRVSLPGRDGRNVVHRVPADHLAGLAQRPCLIAGRPDDRPSSRATPQLQRQGARVDALEGGDPRLDQQLLQRAPGAGGRCHEPRHHHGARMDTPRLQLARVDPIAAHHRVRQDHDLPRIRGIGQDLAPAGGRGGEDQVAFSRAGGAPQPPVEEGAALQREHAVRERKRRLPLNGGWRRALARECGDHLPLLSGIAVPGLKDRGAV